MADTEPTPADSTPAPDLPSTRRAADRPSNRRTTAAAAGVTDGSTDPSNRARAEDATRRRSDPPLTSKTRSVSGTTFPSSESLGARMAAEAGERYFLLYNGIDWFVMERTDDGERRAFNAGRDAARAAEALAAYNEG